MKALTSSMIQTLMDCHEKELQGQEPFSGIAIMQHTKGLILRKFLELRSYTSKLTGRIIVAYFITSAGKQYLQEYLAKIN